MYPPASARDIVDRTRLSGGPQGTLRKLGKREHSVDTEGLGIEVIMDVSLSGNEN
jgi:hypothetical protein